MAKSLTQDDIENTISEVWRMQREPCRRGIVIMGRLMSEMAFYFFIHLIDYYRFGRERHKNEMS